jgi:coenzyme F420-reducing hydrogenase delta subunit
LGSNQLTVGSNDLSTTVSAEWPNRMQIIRTHSNGQIDAETIA